VALTPYPQIWKQKKKMKRNPQNCGAQIKCRFTSVFTNSAVYKHLVSESFDGAFALSSRPWAELPAVLGAFSSESASLERGTK
jgi:hypothetical protein